MILEPEAGEELLAAAAWYDDQRPGLGDEFLSSIDEVLERVATTTSLAARRPDLEAKAESRKPRSSYSE